MDLVLDLKNWGSGGFMVVQIGANLGTSVTGHLTNAGFRTGAIEMGASHVSPPWWNATTNSCYNPPDRWNATTLEGWSLHMVGSGSKREHFVLSRGERGSLSAGQEKQKVGQPGEKKRLQM